MRCWVWRDIDGEVIKNLSSNKNLNSLSLKRGEIFMLSCLNVSLDKLIQINWSWQYRKFLKDQQLSVSNQTRSSIVFRADVLTVSFSSEGNASLDWNNSKSLPSSDGTSVGNQWLVFSILSTDVLAVVSGLESTSAVS